MIHFGTSGFSYNDWIGPVYPQGLSRSQWLPYYAAEFDTIELNVTYYRIPTLSTVQGWVERTPEGFLFSVKLHRSITHERVQPEYTAFLESLGPMIESGKLGCVLAQFPYSFRSTNENRCYLDQLRDKLEELPVVIEFRHQSWAIEDTFSQLKNLHFGYCCVDEPRIRGLMPPVGRATGPVAYVRFHGRNAAKWWNHEHAWERYNYSYAEEELREWIPRLQLLDREALLTLVYANNHYRGQSIDTIRKLSKMYVGQE